MLDVMNMREPARGARHDHRSLLRHGGCRNARRHPPYGRQPRRAALPVVNGSLATWWASCPTATWRATSARPRLVARRFHAAEPGYRYIDDERRRRRACASMHGPQRHGRWPRRRVIVRRGARRPVDEVCRPVRRQAHQEGAGGGERQARRRPVPPQHHALPGGGHRPFGEVGSRR